jgi:UDP-N-acetylglucosamine acyltransferase
MGNARRALIHPSAIVDPAAQLALDVQVGPYCVIGAGVRVDSGTRIESHVVLAGRTTIGRNNRIFSFCAIGTEPQDKKYAGEPTQLVMGDGNTIREYCLFNTGTVQGGGVTRIGSDNWIMGHAHIAHDCEVGDHTIIANAVPLGGHVHVGDWAIIGGTSAVHQFVRVGAHSMCGGGTILTQDLPPFVMCNGAPAQAHGLNAEGLKRRNFSAESIAALRQAYRLVYREKLPLVEARAALETLIGESSEEVAGPLRQLAAFLAEPGRGIVR